ncbi:UNVERIFIED_CONTAM: hypothetical protein RMT77_014691 [Armadillidium vulgare]
MKERFEDYLADFSVILATYFDPRYKLTLYKNAATSRMHSNSITEELARVTKKKKKKKRFTEVEAALSATPGNSTDSDDGGFSANKPTEGEEDLENFKKFMTKIALTSHSPSKESHQGTSSKKLKRQSSRSKDNSELQSVKEEMKLYENMEILPTEENPFMWLHENRPRFPILSVLASKYLSAPPSSVESEGIFSVGGNVNTPKRNRLSPDMSKTLIFLDHNLRLFEFDY